MLRNMSIHWFLLGFLLSVGFLVSCSSKEEPVRESNEQGETSEAQSAPETEQPAIEQPPTAAEQYPGKIDVMEQTTGLPDPPKLPPPANAKAMPAPKSHLGRRRTGSGDSRWLRFAARGNARNVCLPCGHQRARVDRGCLQLVSGRARRPIGRGRQNGLARAVHS